jgi:hypothetical protein
MGGAMIFDIVSSIYVAGTFDFVATTPGAIQKAVNPPIPPAVVVYGNSNGDTWIEPGDNILLQKIEVNVPFGFLEGSGIHFFGLALQDGAGTVQAIAEMPNSSVNIPDLCHGITFPGNGLFISIPSNGVSANKRQQLVTPSIALNISQVNLPAVLNGVTIPIEYHLQFVHTKAMRAVP